MSLAAGQSDYRRKIKTREELRELLGPRPRPRTVIMCHGTFDLVHPGHIRHLIYAKSKADLLVVSVTCDAHITKASYRPFVPQELRAMNLAALEVVDYVIVDDYPTPVENIRFLQPDLFAKGYEYSRQGIHPKTREELAALEAYGGELIFTPGDVIFSSSAFIDHEKPNLAAEKLVTLMDSEGISFEDLRTALGQLAGVKVHVIGDTIVDSYTYCTLMSAMAKTPTFSVKYDRQVDFVGGAGIVAKHLRQAGASVQFSTVLGEDALKEFVLHDLAKHDIACSAFIDHTRPTTQKNVFIAGGYRMLKVDRLDNRPISDKTLEYLGTSLASSQAEAFVFSDFRHGLFSAETVSQLVAALPEPVFRAADSQVATRWGNILDFRDFDLITPNEREARFALGDQDSVIRPLALELYKKARCKALMLKLGDRGMMTYRAPNEDVRSFFTIDSFVQRLVDPVGAGDALLAYATLALVATKSVVMASILGSLAATVACEHEGNTPVTPDQLRGKIQAVEQLVQYA